MAPRTEAGEGGKRPGLDVLLLFLSALATVRVTSLAESAVLPTLRQDILAHPLLGRLLPPDGIAAMGERMPWPGEPLGLLLIAVTIGLVLVYAIVDLTPDTDWQRRAKWLLLSLVITSALFLPTVRLTLLRQANSPASYSHDGGVIQTEATIQFTLEGRNPYSEDYTETPMAEWGFDEYRTALYHYPYLPWTFLFSLPFYLVGDLVGFYDQRLVYLLLLAVMLALAPSLASTSREKFALVVLLGLNPLLGLDIVFGQNDSFILAWILFSLVAWHRWRLTSENRWRILSALLFGLACASKPTAWFLAPFYGLLLVADRPDLPQLGWRGFLIAIGLILRRATPALAVFFLLLGPYLIWDAAALYDDVVRWSSGAGETGYQIWGWGASNFVLAAGWVPDRFSLWPFWAVELVLTLPLLLWFLWRQWQDNRLANACWHYALLLAVFFYGSRFLNENYLGYLLAFVGMGYLAEGEAGTTDERRRTEDGRRTTHQ